jgi:hypothetical protein
MNSEETFKKLKQGIDPRFLDDLNNQMNSLTNYLKETDKSTSSINTQQHNEDSKSLNNSFQDKETKFTTIEHNASNNSIISIRINKPVGKQKSNSTTPLDLSVHESQTNTPRSNYKAHSECVLKENNNKHSSNDVLKSLMDRYNCGVPKPMTTDNAQKGIIYTPPRRKENAIATISINLDNRAKLIDSKQMSINEEIKRDITNKSLFGKPERCEVNIRLLRLVLPFINKKYEKSWFGSSKKQPFNKINENNRTGDLKVNRLSLNSIRDRTKAAKAIQRWWREIINLYDIFIKKLIFIQKHARGYLIRKSLYPCLNISLGIRLTSAYIKNTFLVSYFRTFFSELLTIKHLYEKKQELIKTNWIN